MRPRSSRTSKYVVLLGLLSLALAACGGTATTVTTEAAEESTTTASEEPTETTEPSTEATEPMEKPGFEATSIRIATSPPDFGTITDAYWLRLLEDAGIEVETLEFETDADAVRAAAAGEGDFINSAAIPIMQYIEASGGGLIVVAVELLETDYVLMAPPDLASVNDLEGGVVGISEPGDIADTLTRIVLEEAGADISTMEFAQIGGTSARIAALVDGQIQAGAAHVADGLAAAEEFGLQALLRFVDYVPNYAQRFLAATPQWLEENPVLAQFLVDSMIEAQRWALENKDAYIELSNEVVEGISPEIRSQVYDLFASEAFFAVNGGLELVVPTMEVEQRQGNLGADMVDPGAWTDSSFVEDYLERNGTY